MFGIPHGLELLDHDLYEFFSSILSGQHATVDHHWPYCRAGRSKEEVYLYFDMPRLNFGIQCVYTDGENPEAMLPVFEDDAVIIKEGYHQNVGVPSCGINFVWILCGLREGERDWSEVNFQPGF